MTPPRPGRLVLLGHPVAHSLSPSLQNAALAHAGLSLRYEALDVAPHDLPELLVSLREVHAAGNVTIPHKGAVAARCDSLSPLAARLGAVNTFWHEDGLLHGDNTDVAGFEAMAREMGVARDGVVVACLGAGGAAAAVCAVVERWPGGRLRLWGRSADRVRALAARFPQVVETCDTIAGAVAGCHAVVNATPLGMRDDAMPVEPAALPGDACVMDLVYRPGETRWVRESRALGMRAADGREMLLQQGAAAFERWFGRRPDLDVMRTALAGAARVR